jgi:hypothetical protein
MMLHFTDQELVRLHQELQQRVALKLSTNDALVAHVMTILQTLEPRPNGRDLLVAMNGRRRSGLPDNVVGNYVTMLALPCRDGVAPEELAVQMRLAIKAWQPNYHSLTRFVAAAGGIASSFRMAPAGLRRLPGSVFVSNMAGFGLYDVSFGGPQPSYIMPLASQFPWFAHTLESQQRQGIQFHINLPTSIAKRLRQPAILGALHRYREGASTQPSWLL